MDKIEYIAQQEAKGKNETRGGNGKKRRRRKRRKRRRRRRRLKAVTRLSHNARQRACWMMQIGSEAPHCMGLN